MTATFAEIAPEQTLTHKDLIEHPLWSRLVGRIVRDEQVETAYAERIMDQALGFLALCAQEPGAGYGPSEAVDKGWHTFILYTREYADFCERTAGHFIHHTPSDEAGVDYGEPLDTVAAMRQYGLAVDEELWPNGADSGSTHKCMGDACTNGNKGGSGFIATQPGDAYDSVVSLFVDSRE